ncbi:hypothetical protein [Flavivirga jejuensis]|uniref:Uncharacterized protein n=1 Tax=Flavivirga jejuensis TaxID=870487 RepID=A0ABT8WVP3_9FLAO|nr:hypothetical protein [Flavivirga jejuensis]MDO5977080.1 hypothetical protein [Flavivirga jejuensis]
MKIEFEITKSDAKIIVKALEYAASKAGNQSSVNAIQNAIQEIKEDIQNGIRVLKKLKSELKGYTDGSPILETSKFRTQLGLSNAFIKSDNGLIALMNYILKSFVSFYKPGVKPDFIKKTKIDDAKTIKDLINLIINNYESSN